MMPSDLPSSLVVGIVLRLLVVLSRWLWRGGKATPAAANTSRARRDPTSFAGLTRQPDCPACAQGAGGSPELLPARCLYTTRQGLDEGEIPELGAALSIASGGQRCIDASGIRPDA